MASKQAKERWARDRARQRSWDPEICRLFGPGFESIINEGDIRPFNIIKTSGSLTIGISQGSTEEEAIKNAKAYLKEYEPLVLFPYMEDEINEEPNYD